MCNVIEYSRVKLRIIFGSLDHHLSCKIINSDIIELHLNFFFFFVIFPRLITVLIALIIDTLCRRADKLHQYAEVVPVGYLMAESQR